MRAMKDSGVEWIGEIPQDWEVAQVRYLFNIGRGRVIAQTELVDDGIYPVYSSQTKNEGCLGYINSYDFEDEQLTWTTDGANAGTVFLRKGKHNCTNVCGTLKPLSDSVCLLYQKYALEHIAFYHKRADTNGYKIMNNEMATIKTLIPNIAEQQRIADYLDSKCSKIDAIIEKQQAVIEKLKEYKLSVITEAVTKGLNPDVEMKDSGVEWLGKIPAHWKFLPFKFVLKERSEKNIPIKTSERLSLSIDKGVTLYAEKTTNLDRFKDDVSQYKLTYKGDLVLNSMNMIVGAIGTSNYFGCVSPAYYTYYDDEENHEIARYCDYLLKCKTMRKVLHSLGKGIMSIDRGDDRINTCRLKVSRDDLRSLKIPVPPLNEQREIISYLNDVVNKIDKTIKDRLIVIEKIKEYKKSFIYEVVTGKKEV